jgi:hypothetical protein
MDRKKIIQIKDVDKYGNNENKRRKEKIFGFIITGR